MQLVVVGRSSTKAGVPSGPRPYRHAVENQAAEVDVEVGAEPKHWISVTGRRRGLKSAMSSVASAAPRSACERRERASAVTEKRPAVAHEHGLPPRPGLDDPLQRRK